MCRKVKTLSDIKHESKGKGYYSKGVRGNASWKAKEEIKKENEREININNIKK